MALTNSIGMPNRARPDLKYHSLDEVLADVDRLRSGPVEQAGQWNLAMTLDHMAKAMSAHDNPKVKPMPWPVRWIVRAGVHRMVRRGRYPSIKFPAPKRALPDPNVSLESACAKFRVVVEGLRTMQGPIVANTPFGDLSLDEFQKLQLLHAAHHLSFLRRRAE
jgi:hypothetical protein